MIQNKQPSSCLFPGGTGKRKPFLFLPSFLLAVAILLAGCGQLRTVPVIRTFFETPQPDTGPTPTPLPTSVAPAFPVVAPRACKVAELESLRTDLPQGDLMAWAPGESTLAFIGPAANTIWYTGSLHTASAPDFTASGNLATDIYVWGDVTWSPQADALAFVAWRPPDTHTIMTVPAAGGRPIDLLPEEAAVTDSIGSSKAIQEWRGSYIYALTACGPDCDQSLVLNPSGGILSSGELGRRRPDRLDAARRVSPYNQDTYPSMLLPNWSPDGKQVVYFDVADRVWVLLTQDAVQYILTIPVTYPRETKWSPDSRWLALRSDDMIEIFDTTCQPEN